jgi:hypothetical protein
MSIYNPNIPIASDDLSDSQGQILQNFNRANSSFGIDHYPFADLTVNNGKHNVVTTPAYVATPPTGLAPTTIAAEPKMYAFQDSANLGVLNYSRGPSNAVPTPLTHLQSSAAPIVVTAGNTTPVLDFTGLTEAICMIYATDLGSTTAINFGIITWNGSIMGGVGATLTEITFVAVGNVLHVKNNTAGLFSNLYWTLDVLRCA